MAERADEQAHARPLPARGGAALPGRVLL